jgi:hypothetical protein
LAQLAYLSLLWVMLSLACAGVTQVLKTPIKIAWKQRVGSKLKGDHLALYQWSIRTLTILAGVAAGIQPHVWPTWVSRSWAVMLGTTAGCMSVGVYHAAKMAIPKAIAVLPDAIRKRLGG